MTGDLFDSGPAPFLIVTPLGMPAREELSRRLGAEGIGVVGRAGVADWVPLATALYARGGEADHKALAFEAEWRRRFPDCRAECWVLSSLEEFARLADRKREIRRGLPALTVTLEWQEGENAVTRPSALHPFHAPDVDRLAREWGLVRRACLGGCAAGQGGAGFS